MGILESEIISLQKVAQTTSIGSLIGCLFILLNFILYSNLRSFCYRVICLLVICELFNSISGILGGHLKHASLCGIQATIKSFFTIASILWCIAISFTLYMVVVKQKLAVERFFTKYNYSVWSVSLILTGLPALTKSYSHDFDHTCWISSENGVSIAWQFITLYVPLWIGILFISGISFNIYYSVNAVGLRTSKAIYQILRNYQYLVFVTQLFPSIHRIALISKKYNMGLMYIHEFLVHSGVNYIYICMHDMEY